MEKLNRHRPLFGSLLFYGGILACMMPALAALLFVYSSGVNIPFADEWHFVADHYDKWCNGTLTISDLFSQHNEHRIAFARLLMLVTGGLTHYNGVAILYVIQMLFVLVALVFLAAFRDRFGGKPRAFVACAFVPISFMVFQLRQWENMILPIQTQTMLATSGSLAAFLLLSRFVRNGKATHGLLALALLAACVASFSQMMGLFVWPSALVVFLCGARRRKLLYAAVWAVAGCLVWLAYFHHFKKPWQTPDPLGMLHNPRQFAEYLSACLGGSLFWTVGAATTAGVVIAVLLIGAALLVCVRRRWQENTFWIAAAAFSLIVVAVISTGRCGFGVDQALSSRYSAFSLLLLPAVYAVLLDSACEWRSRVGMGLIVILTGLLFWSAMPSYTNGFAEGRNFRLRQEQNAFYLTAFDDIPEEFLVEVHPPTYAITMAMGTMKRFDAGFMRYKTRGVVFPPSIDYPDLSTLHADATGITADCSIGTIPLRAQDQPVPLEHKARFVYVTGWAIDQVAHRPAGGIHVVIDDTFIPVFIGARRDDIARAFSNPDYCHCGFVVAVPVTLIGPGSHHISVLFLNARRTAYSAFPFSAVVQIPGAR